MGKPLKVSQNWKHRLALILKIESHVKNEDASHQMCYKLEVVVAKGDMKLVSITVNFFLPCSYGSYWSKIL